MGFDIRMIKLSGSSFAVDTLNDLKKVRKYLKNGIQQNTYQTVVNIIYLNINSANIDISSMLN